MKDDAVDELQLMREQHLAEHGGDSNRAIKESIRRQFREGRDIYGLWSGTGRIELLFQALKPWPERMRERQKALSRAMRAARGEID